jgi:membrane protein YqaA with SNARE-associated domain
VPPGNTFSLVYPFAWLPLAEFLFIATMLPVLKKRITGYCSRLNHFDNQFLTYTVMLHDWLNQPGYTTLFLVSFLASTLLPLGSEWLLVMMLANGYEPFATVGTATAGNYLGAVTTYLIGMYGGDWLITKVLRVSSEQQQRASSHYRSYGTFSLFFSWLPVIGDPLCLVGGVLRVNFWVFTLLVASGKLVRYAVVAYITLRTAG